MYLSLPISGRDLKAVKVFAKRVKQKWERKGFEVITPFDVTENHAGNPDERAHYASCMGCCIEALLMCDGVIFCEGWFYSKGCRAEWNIAEIYEKKRVLDDSRFIGGLENGEKDQV